MKKFASLSVLYFLGTFFFGYAGDAIGAPQNENQALKPAQKNAQKAYDLSTVLVKFKERGNGKERKNLARLVGGKFKDKNDDGIDDRYERILGGRLALIELDGDKGTDAASKALRVLRNHPLLEYAEYNYLQHIALSPDDPRLDDLWGLHNTGQTGGSDDADIDATEAWNISTGASEVIVGVIDTGVDYNHKDLRSNIWTNPGEIPANGNDDDGNGYVDDVHGINAITGTGDPMDDHYHGTHCSGTLGAVGDNRKGVVGVNWTVKIIGMKFLNSSGSGTTADAIECVNYAVALKNSGVNIRVLNNSWGGGPYSQGLKDAISTANDVDILFVAAAGNDSSDNDLNPYYPASYDLPNVLAVAATDHNDNLNSLSNYGHESVDLGAPGSSILSTFPGNGYGTLSGTSMATPHVAGVAALMLSVNDTLTVLDLIDYLMIYGDGIPALDGRSVSGKRLNAHSSLGQVIIPSEPTFRLSAEPATVSITQGNTGSFTVNIESVLGFSDPVGLSASSNPEAIADNIDFNPNPGTPGSPSDMEVVTTADTDPGYYIITVTGSSVPIVKTTTVTLEVTPENLTTVSYTNNTVIPIPDVYPPDIGSANNVFDSLTVWNIACEVNITHTYIGDLIVRLISPLGTEAILHNRAGGSVDDIHQTYYPTEFRDEEGSGPWTLRVSDHAGQDVGTLDSWTLTIDGVSTGPVNEAPTVTIIAPTPEDSSFDEGADVTFEAIADDAEDDDISSGIVWTLDIDSAFGTGSSITTATLSVGSHIITATATDLFGKSGSDSITITIDPTANNSPPTANFGFVTAKLKATFTDNSTDDGTIVSWLWHFGGNKTSEAQNPRHRYRRKGKYEVTLTVTDDDGATDTISHEVTVTK